jgi:uncharacterized RmlC-like cupin family protein/uncharacterized damage-inducible protein DinB
MLETSLLSPIRKQREKTLAVLETLSKTDLDRVHGPSGWTVRQLFGHIAAAQLGAAFFVRRAKDGDLIEMDLGARDQFNELEVEKASRFDLGQLKAELQDSSSAVEEVFEELHAGDLEKPIVWPEWPAKNIKDSIHHMAAHEGEHLGQVREALAGKVRREAPVRVIRTDDLVQDVASGAMKRAAACSTELTGSEKLWAGTSELGPGASSAAHHHGEAESVIYMVSGHARFYFGKALDEVEEAGPGDFVWVPPHSIHVEMNLSKTKPVQMVVVRSTQEALVFNVDRPKGWKAR